MRYVKLIAVVLCIAAITLFAVSCRDVTDADFLNREDTTTEAYTEEDSSQSTVGSADTEGVTTETEIVLDESVSLSSGTVESYLKHSAFSKAYHQGRFRVICHRHDVH